MPIAAVWRGWADFFCSIESVDISVYNSRIADFRQESPGAKERDSAQKAMDTPLNRNAPKEAIEARKTVKKR